ncbi:MAG: VCBS repeat-containing protein, partial [Lewinella sp.]
WGDATPPKPEWNWWSPAEDERATQWRTTPYTIDWNDDGLMDLIMLDAEGYLAYFERAKEGDELVLRPGEHIFYGIDAGAYDNRNNVTDKEPGPLQLNSGLHGGSGRRKLAFTDWDQDGDLDLILNGLNAVWFENTGESDGRVNLRYRGNISEQKLAGHTTSPTIVDWNKDGIPDLLLGAEDGFFYYLKNQHSNE